MVSNDVDFERTNVECKQYLNGFVLCYKTVAQCLNHNVDAFCLVGLGLGLRVMV